jgi:hypothetical protein
MKTITLISLFLTLFVEFSCNETITKENAKDELQTLLTVPISDSFKITDYEVGGVLVRILPKLLLHTLPPKNLITSLLNLLIMGNEAVGFNYSAAARSNH